MNELRTELKTLVGQVPELSGRVFNTFSIEELEQLVRGNGYPIAGVTYEGSARVDNDGKPATSALSSAGMLVTRNFVIVVGVNYRYVESGQLQLEKGEALLESIIPNVLGYQGVNTRPWRYAGETAMETLLEGAVFYGQMWETTVPFTSNF